MTLAFDLVFSHGRVPSATKRQVLVTYPRPFWRELGMSGNAMSYGGGPIQQLYDSCGPDDSSDGPHALCGFVFGNGGGEPAADDILRPQVRPSINTPSMCLRGFLDGSLLKPSKVVDHRTRGIPCRPTCAGAASANAWGGE